MTRHAEGEGARSPATSPSRWYLQLPKGARRRRCYAGKEPRCNCQNDHPTATAKRGKKQTTVRWAWRPVPGHHHHSFMRCCACAVTRGSARVTARIWALNDGYVQISIGNEWRGNANIYIIGNLNCVFFLKKCAKKIDALVPTMNDALSFASTQRHKHLNGAAAPVVFPERLRTQAKTTV